MKYYAVRKGKEKGIFNTWQECKERIEGYKGAEYKSFKERSQAQTYLDDVDKDIGEKDILIAYVDGSFSKKARLYGSGAVFLYNGQVIAQLKRAGSDPELLTMRNVSGELIAALMSMDYALEQGYRELLIRYDYAGIEKWAKGEWKTNKDGTKRYREKYLSYKDKIDIHFQKVQAHSGNKYNDIADQLAKESIMDERIGLKQNKEVPFLVGNEEDYFKDIRGYKSLAKINILYGNKLIDEKFLYNVIKNKIKESDFYIKDVEQIKTVFDYEAGQFIIQLNLRDKSIERFNIELKQI